MLCKWNVDTDDGGRENWLPVHLGKCSESNTWDIFWLTRKVNVLVSELIDGEPSMSKGVVESVGSHTIDCWSLTFLAAIELGNKRPLQF